MSEPAKKERNPLYAYQGQMLPLSAVAKASGMSLPALRFRIDSGMSIDEALKAPVRTQAQVTRLARKRSPWRNELLFQQKR